MKRKLLTFVLLLAATALWAQIQDNSFGTNGIVTTKIGTSDANLSATALQSDGKIIAVGSSNNGSNKDITIVRYNSNGSLDNTFGNNGVVTIDVNGFDDNATCVAIQKNGDIVVGGYLEGHYFNDTTYINYNYDYALAVRVKNNGIIDSTFGNNGIFLLFDGGGEERKIINSIVIRNDNKVLLAGSLDYKYYSVISLNTNGTIDNTFGDNGISKIKIENGSVFHVKGMVLNNDTILIAGHHSENYTGQYFDYNCLCYMSTYYSMGYYGLLKISASGNLIKFIETKVDDIEGQNERYGLNALIIDNDTLLSDKK